MSSASPAVNGSLADLAQFSLDRAKVLGATAAEVEISASFGQDVTVRMGEVETIEHHRDKGLGITVYLGQHRGNASTTDLSREAIERTVKAALAIAKYTAADEFAGLADAHRFALPPFANFDLYRPWTLAIDEAIAIGKRMEAAAFAVDKRINNSELA